MSSVQKISGFSKAILAFSLLMLAGQIVSIFFTSKDVAVGHISFQIFENVLMIIVVFMPVIIGRKTSIVTPISMEIAFVGFCFASLVMGDLFDFYGKFPWWDMVLHVISGVMLGIIGYAIINKSSCNIGLVISWVLCFALAAGAMWEIWEYVTDGLFGLNSQEFQITSGTFDNSVPRQGRDALKDTMQDLILDFIGSLAVAIVIFCDYFRKVSCDSHQKTP